MTMKAFLSLAGVAACVGIAAGSGFGRVQPQVNTPPAPARTHQPASELAPSFGGHLGYTRPSQDSVMSFTFPVEIAEILVKGGQRVARGDVLVRGRDEEYRHQRDIQKIMAESDLDVQRAQAQLDQAQVELDNFNQAKRRGGAVSQVEFDRAETTVKLRTAELAIAKREREQHGVQLAMRESQLERLTMRAPFDGRVDRISGDVGVVKRETDPVLRVVSTDPMWIDISPPTRETLMLGTKHGDPAWVFLDVPAEPKVLVGKVIEVAPDADFGADTRRVRVELVNPQDWPTGVAAWVRFSAPTGEWAARVVDPSVHRAGAGTGAPIAARRDGGANP
jgi:RND family efflux transporter MFP subunit